MAIRKPPAKRYGRAGVHRLVERRNPNILGIRRIMKEVHGFMTPVSMEGRSVKRAKAMQLIFERHRDAGAEELAAKRKIYVPGRKGGPMPVGRTKVSPIWGCHSECLVVYDALKELGGRHGIDFKPELVRKVYYLREGQRTLRRPHTEIIFELGGKKYIADPFNESLRLARPEDLKAPRISPEPISKRKYFEEMARDKPEEEFPLGIGGNP